MSESQSNMGKSEVLCLLTVKKTVPKGLDVFGRRNLASNVWGSVRRPLIASKHSWIAMPDSFLLFAFILSLLLFDRENIVDIKTRIYDPIRIATDESRLHAASAKRLLYPWLFLFWLPFARKCGFQCREFVSLEKGSAFAFSNVQIVDFADLRPHQL